MYLPILGKRLSSASGATEDCVNAFRSCPSPTTEASPGPSPTSGETDGSQPGWYIHDGPHRYMGAVIVAVMLLIVFAVYLHVGKLPRRLWGRLFNRSQEQRGSGEPNGTLSLGHEKEKWNESSSPESEYRRYAKSPSLEATTDYRIAPEQIAWLPEKPKACLQQKARTVELEWSHPVGQVDRRDNRRRREERRRSKKSNRRSRRSQIQPTTV